MKVVTATPDLINRLLAKPLRQADVDEWVLASGGLSVPAIVREAVVPEQARVCLNDEGEPVVLWGMAQEEDSNLGILWLIATKEAEKDARKIARLWPEEERQFFETAGHLYAIAWDGNTTHQEWLRRMGFEEDGNMLALGVHRFTIFRKDHPACADLSQQP